MIITGYLGSTKSNCDISGSVSRAVLPLRAPRSALPVPATPSPTYLSNGFRSKGPLLELVTVDR